MIDLIANRKKSATQVIYLFQGEMRASIAQKTLDCPLCSDVSESRSRLLVSFHLWGGSAACLWIFEKTSTTRRRPDGSRNRARCCTRREAGGHDRPPSRTVPATANCTPLPREKRAWHRASLPAADDLSNGSRVGAQQSGRKPGDQGAVPKPGSEIEIPSYRKTGRRSRCCCQELRGARGLPDRYDGRQRQGT